MALTFTQSDLDNLKAALVSGATEVQVGDRLIKYRNQKDIVEAIRLVQVFLEGLNKTTTASTIKATYNKGSK